MHDLYIVFGLGMLTALATGLGAIPFLFVSNVKDRTRGIANAIAVGLMLGASIGLLHEGSEHGIEKTVLGALAGVVFVLALQRWLADRDVLISGTHGADGRRMLLIVLVMTVHSIAEGVAVGAAMAGGGTLAVAITAAIAVHNIPEGIAISAVMRPRGVSLLACAGWSIFSSLPQPLVAVPAFLFVERVTPALPAGLGFAAGAMFYMVLEELLPEAYEHCSRLTVALVVSVSLLAMVLFQGLIG